MIRRPSSRPRRTARRVANLVATAALSLGLLGCLALLVPALLGYDRYVITGGSMTGSVEKYAVVFADEVPVDGLAVGDVITYLPPADAGTHSLVTHRIIEIGTSPEGHRVLRTQGDANPDPDPWQFELVEPTVNRMAWHIPFLGRPMIALADPDVRRLVIGAPATVVALLAARELVGAMRRPRPRGGAGAPAATI